MRLSFRRDSRFLLWGLWRLVLGSDRRLQVTSVVVQDRPARAARAWAPGELGVPRGHKPGLQELPHGERLR